jgi:hypothetical protein
MNKCALCDDKTEYCICIKKNNNPCIKDRTLKQALDRAEIKKSEMSQICQLYPSDWDTIILANEVIKLRKIIKKIQLERLTETKNINSIYSILI